MSLSDLVPWSRQRSVAPTRFSDEGDSLFALHREMNRIFDDFARGLGLGLPARSGAAGIWPHVEVSETDKEVTVVAELPGLDQNDVDLSLADGVLTLKGRKERESNGALYSERWHGAFQRSVSVGADVDPEKVSATFKNGVLTVTLGKRPEAQSQVRRIAISAG
jgi:HSP20 family protein